ncbi:hypothetical protein B484DRAFT_390225 [Ochromonadaceae sp. CCMP2298]|nr:hypothetical protein B484DRAFT_390225 [Ochromonadaceae sp. CCMP2298]
MINSALSITKVWSTKQLPRWKRRALVTAMVKRNRTAERASYAIEEMGRHSDEMFVRMFRLDRASFDELVERL